MKRRGMNVLAGHHSAFDDDALKIIYAAHNLAALYSKRAAEAVLQLAQNYNSLPLCQHRARARRRRYWGPR